MGCWVLEGLYFETNKADIKPKYYPILEEVITVLNKNPQMRVEIQGHTDNRGAAAYNMTLSDKRAESVKNYLAEKGIASWRLSSKGYGLTQPAATNATAEGRAMNRRVQLKPIY